ncbi:MAG: ABC transporter permease [Firmicutes bacterium]|jgi:ABC-type dipeptide/oligopeptide/nickel transport system permease component|nr:ABC transporter permease [Bacillota bacterium]
MIRYIVRRLVQMIPLLVGISILVFLLVHLSPGDPIRMLLGEEATEEDVERLNAIYGFDLPLHIQYFRWLSNALRGNLGVSIRQGIPVTTLLFERLGATLELAVVSVFIAVALGIPLGIIAAVRRGTLVDYFSMILALVGVSTPGFWLGLMLLTHVALRVDFLPMFGRDGSIFGGLWVLITQLRIDVLMDGLRHVLLPAVSIGTSMMAIITRLTRSSMLEVLGRDYIRTAKAKGLNNQVVVLKHALRNALLPVITIIGIQFGAMLGGAVVTETVFAWPGVGRLIVNAIRQRDFPIIQGGVLMMAVVFALVNLAVDASYALVNPRIRYD